MKKLILLVALFVSPVFAQEEEQEIRIELESGGSPAVGMTESIQRPSVTNSVVATPDGSVWYSIGGGIVYCSVDEDGNPHCEEVDVED